MKKVLVVDDIVEMAASLKGILNAYGLECDVAFKPSEAYNLIKSTKYDLVLCDTEMPEMPGYYLKKKLDDEGIKSCFIGMSGLKKYKENWEKLGCEFIEKGGVKFYDDIKIIMEELKKE